MRHITPGNASAALLLLMVLLNSVPTVSGQQLDTLVVRFHDTDELLNNPGKGFTTFQRFNGDELNPGAGWTEGFPIEYQEFDGNLENEGYPQTTIAYHRVYWQYVEPEMGEYNWELIDKALRTAHERGQKLMLRIPAHGSGTDERRDVPAWYREMVGYDREWEYDNPVNAWLVNPEDPRYVQYYGGMIRALGERYDGHPDLEAVDMALVGAWGEGAGSDILSDRTRQGLVRSYTDAFQKTPLIMLLTDRETNGYGLSQADVGWRVDCLGDIGFWADEQNGWSHMYDHYPRYLMETRMQDAWKRGPVSLEICYTFLGWRDRGGFGEKELEYIFDQALKWRISSFNAKSSPVPEEWEPMVEEWIKKMGYRFVLRRFSWPESVAPGGKLEFTSWWENRGVAPIYTPYPLVLRLRSGDNRVVMLTEVDIRDWMPGDNLYDDAVFVPYDLAAGTYELELAIVKSAIGSDPEPAVLIPVRGRSEEGWVRLGEIRVESP